MGRKNLWEEALPKHLPRSNATLTHFALSGLPATTLYVKLTPYFYFNLLKRKLYILSGNSALPTIEKVVTKKQDSLNKTQNLL